MPFSLWTFESLKGIGERPTKGIRVFFVYRCADRDSADKDLTLIIYYWNDADNL